MIIPITINTDDLLSQFELTKDQIEDMCDNIAKGLGMIYFSKLEQQAINNLHSTRDRYLKAIKFIDSGRLESTILLDYSKDKLIKMLEEGAAPFDMKEALLKGPNSKETKSGTRYNTVPFRWATPDAVGESSAFNSKLPDEIYQEVKKKDLNVPSVGGGTQSQPLSIGEIPKPFQNPQSRKEIKDSDGKVLFKEYEHKNSIYEGIIKTNDSNTGQNRYFSFRRVSENSDPDAFIFPGIEKYALMEKAYQSMNIDQEVGDLLDTELIKLGY